MLFVLFIFVCLLLYFMNKLSKIAFMCFLVVVITLTYTSCKKDPIEVPLPETPTEDGVSVPLNAVPYEKLSDYRFFQGDMKNQIPAEGVYEYEPISSLFTDYALKKRFIWMPQGVSATYNGDGQILNFPIGTALIKNFYYTTISPGNTTKIIETRVMILKPAGWVFAEYVWNNEQTEAYLNMNGSHVAVTWDQNGEILSTNYRIPSQTECMVCHKINDTPIPIGVKPQSMNKDFNYPEGMKNQLQKLVEVGYLSGVPPIINSVVDYSDPMQPLDLRLRSYLDVNCAHCHSDNKHCDYRPIRLAFSETTLKTNIGLCVEPGEMIDPSMNYIIVPSNIERSVMHFRLNSNDESMRMPLLGRTIVHKEGVQLLEDWINTILLCE